MLLATLTTALVVLEVVGVKVAVKDVPLPLSVPRVPPEKVMSDLVKSVEDSLKVKVRVAVSPAFKDDLLLMIEIVGEVKSSDASEMV